jgi:hypothetical protein
MLRTHGRYAYSNITKRPDYSWPGGKRLAVYGAVNIEQFNRYGDYMWLTRPRGNCTHTENLPAGIVPGS